MKKNVRLLFALMMIINITQVAAQSKLIHYWHFNNYTSVAGGWKTYTTVPTLTVNAANPAIIHADYSTIDTAKAKIVYQTSAGTSSAFTTTLDWAIPGDTNNVQLGHASDTSIISCALRPRNRCDSMELRFYIPTTNYKNIALKYGAQTSSVTSGPRQQSFDYSLDSGATWKTSGLSIPFDSAKVAFAPISVNFIADTNVNNNRKFVFRIKFFGNTSGTSGNNRFDNVTVMGDTILPVVTPPATRTLVHYWHFNNFATSYTNPGIPALKADWSVLDTNIARVKYNLATGTSPYYGGYIDFVTPGSDSNARTIASVVTPAGNGYRFRNPSDSAYLTIYIPSINYKNLELKYACQSSSSTSGMLRQNFSYSTDSGATWKTAGLSKTYDSTSPSFKVVTIDFPTDTTVNNNSKLVFRINFAGNTSLTSGNNRFDNITLDGVVIDPTFVYKPSTTAISNVATPANYCSLFPNPVSNQLQLHSNIDGKYSVVLYNAFGQKKYEAAYNQNDVTINVSSLATGIYFAQITNESGMVQQLKFLKQ
jgi:hypothetical protein